MNIKILSLAMLLASAAGLATAYGCEMTFTLIGPAGGSAKILPGRSVDLIQGQQYVLRVEFYEDHKKCLHDPDETIFLVAGRQWKPGDSSQPLALGSSISWRSDGRTNTAEIRFTAKDKGTCELEVIRECDKGGYDELFTFKVK